MYEVHVVVTGLVGVYVIHGRVHPKQLPHVHVHQLALNKFQGTNA